MPEDIAVIVIPADASQPCRRETISRDDVYGSLERLLNVPQVERAAYERDAALFIDYEGAVNGSPPNLRATLYAFPIGLQFPYILYGDIAVAGTDQDTEITDDVPEHLYQRFGVEHAKETTKESGLFL